MRQTIAVLLTMAAVACSTPAAEPQGAPQRQAAQPPGDLPDGWKAHLDDPAAAPGGVGAVKEKDSVTFTTGPAGIYYKPDMKAENGYTVSATFSQLKPTPTPQPYGLFVSGQDLDKATARYTALLVRADGQYQIVSWNGAAPKVVVDWTPAAQMREPKGVKTSNTLTIRAMQDAVHFLIGDKEVNQMPRASAGGDGLAGVRIGPGLNVQVDQLGVKKFP